MYFRKLLAFILGGLMGASLLSGEEATERPVAEVMRDLNRQWIEVQQEREEQRLRLERERRIQETNLELLRAEREHLLKQKETLEQEVATFQTELEALQPAKETYLEWARTWDRDLAELNLLYRDLLPGLPAPLREEIQSLDPFLESSDSSATNPRLQKIRNLVDALNRVQAFDGGIRAQDEVVVLSDGTRYAARVWYLGLSQGYFLTEGTPHVAGFGLPSESGWKWQRRPELVGPLESWQSILKRETPPQWIPLPLEVNP